MSMDIERLSQSLDIEALCALLPVIRAELGISQTDVAARIPVTQTSVSDWERRVQIPTRRNERRLRQVLVNEVRSRKKTAVAA